MLLPTLSANEKKLLAVFAATLFAIANIWGWTQFSSQRSLLLGRIDQLESHKAETRYWLGEKDFWLQRADWLQAHQPRFPNTSEANGTLAEFLQKSASANSITLQQQTLSAPVELSPYNTQINIELRGEGTMQNLVTWFHQTSSPSLFRWIRQITLKKDPNSDKLTFVMAVAQIFTIGHVQSTEVPEIQTTPSMP